MVVEHTLEQYLHFFTHLIVFTYLFVHVFYCVFDEFQVFFFFWLEIHTTSTPITSGTHTDGGAVIWKPGSAWLEGTHAVSIIFMFCLRIVVFK